MNTYAKDITASFSEMMRFFKLVLEFLKEILPDCTKRQTSTLLASTGRQR